MLRPAPSLPAAAFLTPLLFLLALPSNPAGALAQGLSPAPPSAPVKLVFIHHSTGENWLNDENGGLGLALRDNGYFVSDTNYGWGPADADAGSGTIGDHTDIGNWYSWFSGPHRDTYLAALYAENGTHAAYTRLGTDPGGENRIVLFKSCFPNSQFGGSPSDPVPSIGSNPLRGEDSGSSAHTIANAKGIYVELLNYFATRPDKLFVVVTAPPLSAEGTDTASAANARALNNWLVNEWLRSYPLHNVAVFDFYNVLTSDGGTTRTNDPSTNDLGWADGNHHRWRGGGLEHVQTVLNDMSAYPGNPSDSHPTRAGNLKATGEFAAFLNVAYHCWKGDGGCLETTPGSCSLACAASVSSSATVNSPVSFQATAYPNNCAGTPTFDWSFGEGQAHSSQQNATHSFSTAGTFTWALTVSVDGQTCTRSGSVTVTEGTTPGGSLVSVIPAVSHSPGLYGSLWRSDVAAVNTSSASANLTLTFVPGNGGAATRTATVPGLGTREWADVLTSLFGYEASAQVSGALHVTSDVPLVLASRTFSQGSTGTCGAYVPAVTVSGALSSGQTGYLPHLKKSASYRTNIGVTNLGAAPVTVTIRLVGGSGAAVGSERSLTVAAGSLLQETDVFTKSGAGDQEIAYAVLEVKTAGGKAWAFASVIDNATGDPTIVPIVIP